METLTTFKSSFHLKVVSVSKVDMVAVRELIGSRWPSRRRTKSNLRFRMTTISGSYTTSQGK